MTPAVGRLRKGLALAVCLLMGCGTLPLEPAPSSPRPVSQFLRAPDTSALGQMASQGGVTPGHSGFRPLVASGLALGTRLALIEQAEVSLDLQTYLLGDDSTGHDILRALRSAAARGVRVRVLIDDFYTAGLTDLLLGLAAHPGVELRVYNPFPHGRDSPWLRLGSLLSDFERLNRRMHNKLLIADGQVAIVGGRNLADAYFMRSQEANFLDFDLLCVGAVAPALGGHFDTFWNSRFAVPLPALANNGLDADQRRRSFEVLTAQAATKPLSDASPREAAAAWPAGQEALGAYPLVTADAQIFFDSPEKTAGLQRTGDLLPMAGLLAGAREKVVIVTPYFLPSATGMDRLRSAQAKGVAVQVITNSLQDGDEPLVSVAYGQRRLALLSAGVRLFEISSARLRRTDKLGKALGASVGSLHAKLGIIDNSILLVGSMNLDPRSATTNTELALAIHSPALVSQVLAEFQPTDGLATLEVRSRPDGQTLEWVARDGANNETVSAEPSLAWWQQAWLWWLYRFIPDALL